jgi:hypothetical protein
VQQKPVKQFMKKRIDLAGDPADFGQLVFLGRDPFRVAWTWRANSSCCSSSADCSCSRRS